MICFANWNKRVISLVFCSYSISLSQHKQRSGQWIVDSGQWKRSLVYRGHAEKARASDFSGLLGVSASLRFKCGADQAATFRIKPGEKWIGCAENGSDGRGNGSTFLERGRLRAVKGKVICESSRDRIQGSFPRVLRIPCILRRSSHSALTLKSDKQ